MRNLEAEAIAYEKRAEQIRLAGDYHKRAEIGRVCARFELESDEFYTAEKKAIQIINAR